MVFCSNCGAENADAAKFCAICGKDLFTAKNPRPEFDPFDTTRNDPSARKIYTANTSVKEKETFIAILLSLIFPGLGVVYVGKTIEGILMIIANLVCFVLSFPFFILWSMCVIIWLSSMFYAMIKADEYNRALRTTGQPPW